MVVILVSEPVTKTGAGVAAAGGAGERFFRVESLASKFVAGR